MTQPKEPILKIMKILQVKLTRKHQQRTMLIDEDDWIRFGWIPWKILRGNGGRDYVRHKIMVDKREYVIFLHRLIVAAPDDLYVDHINGNSLDNRKCNLRLCTSRENSRNRGVSESNCSSKYKGVTFRACSGTWEATIRTGSAQLYLGRFKSEKEAAEAYNQAAIKYHGNFVKLNILS